MTKLFQNLIFFFAVLGFVGCSAPRSLNQPASTPEKWIKLEINESLEFHFEKADNEWTGSLTLYNFNKNDEKVITRRFISAGDSTWNDFNSFVEFLNLYEIEPQHEIDGWFPDSGNLPRRVYSFELYNGNEILTYSYQDPESELFKYWQSQNVVTFVTYVQNELNWREVEREKSSNL